MKTTYYVSRGVAASDAFILDSYFEPEDFPVVHVQCVARTKSLLYRAGFKRPRHGRFYEVAVKRDRFDRLQLVGSEVEA